jgi:DNA (cytosine-5)-methyltransferase 1
LNAADYGDATSRRRLFLQARKGRTKITWPEPTHFPPEKLESVRIMIPHARPYRPAREIIRWDVKGQSIYSRKKPLAPKTMMRILAGLIKFSGLPFFVGAGGPTGSGRPQPITKPLNTILTQDHQALITPWLVVLQNNRDGLSLESPLPTILTSGAHFGLCDGCIVPVTHAGGDRTRSVEKPLLTITTAHRGEMGIATPQIIPANDYLVKYYEGSDAASLDDPLSSSPPKL